MDLSLLNEPQRQAVTTTEGPLLVLAGAGSGKTRVLTHRIAYLIQECGVSPWNILALTFTNKAAGEMRDRVEQLIGCNAQSMWVTTFHSCCARILRSEITLLGYEKTFVIYDDADQQSLLKRIIKDMNLNDKVFTARNLSSQISDAKNHSLDAEQYFRDSFAPKEVLGAYLMYRRQLKKNNALDFDDLLILTRKLFTEHPDVLQKYREKFRYIHVDEYQDTNMVQYHIVQSLAEQHRNLCVVGDDDQSIYGWRGADIRNILEFEKDFPGATIIRLEQNYRSTQTILNLANTLIANNHSRKPKRLWTDKAGGAPIELNESMDERDEANRICSYILRDARDNGRSYDSYAILYRTHAQSRTLEMYLKNYCIPYRVYGGTSFFQRAEVKDILAYLKLLYNPNDDVSFLRIVNVPRRGFGEAAIAGMQSYADSAGLSLFPAMLTMPETANPRLYPRIKAFCDLMQGVYREIGSRPLAEVTEMLLDGIGYDAYLREDRKENYEARSDIVREFLSYIAEFTSDADESATDMLQQFLENVSLYAEADNIDEQNGRVGLMTLHSAKGLEFPVVFITGLEEGLFPSSQSAFEAERLEEERRLFYVGITRAKEELHLSYARQRMQYGHIESSMPSSFLRELKETLPVRETYRSRVASATAAAAPAEQDMHTLSAPKREARRTVPRFSISANAETAKPSAEASPVAYGAGARITHKTFGLGTVLSVTGDGASQIIEIAFDSGINKKFAAAYAPIEQL